eukprot:Phypoly_transcript_12364.p1 GENE.Phypoly_transcript_12364~~Phypoly_transcript_12364.p1  ORF type:complete len:349 (+),score=73.21 Phypoly_transcript_12364:71-1048(+)
MDVLSLNKLTVPQLKKELKERGLPLGGVKADLVSRLHASFMVPGNGLLPQQPQPLQQIPHQHIPHQQIPQQQIPQHQHPQFIDELQQMHALQQHTTTTTVTTTTPQQLYTPQSNQFYQLPLLTTNLSPLIPKTASKTMTLELGLVDPRDKFGAVVSTAGFGEDDVVQHEGYEWGFYCTKSMDYQVWATVYFKCLKKHIKKRGLTDDVPSVEATVEFPTGKKVKGVLHKQNQHRLVVIKEANTQSLTKSFGASDKQTINNVKVTLRTLTEGEARTADQTAKKKPKAESEQDLCPDWGVNGQMDSDDENRSEYESSDYSSNTDSGPD